MDSVTFDLTQTPLREVNHFLHHNLIHSGQKIRILNPNGAHNLAVGLDAPVEVEIMAHACWLSAGMRVQAAGIHPKLGTPAGPGPL